MGDTKIEWTDKTWSPLRVPRDPNWETAMRALQLGWDSYSAIPITDAAIGAVKRFLAEIGDVQVTPTCAGGLQIDWPHAELAFGASGEQEFDVDVAAIRAEERAACISAMETVRGHEGIYIAIYSDAIRSRGEKLC